MVVAPKSRLISSVDLEEPSFSEPLITEEDLSCSVVLYGRRAAQVRPLIVDLVKLARHNREEVITIITGIESSSLGRATKTCLNELLRKNKIQSFQLMADSVGNYSNFKVYMPAYKD